MDIKFIAQTLFLLLILYLFGSTFGANLRTELPHVRIVEISRIITTKLEVGEGETEKVINKAPNTDIIVGEDIQPNSKLIFECDAPYPVQWVYNGDGMPEYSTNTSSNSLSKLPPPEGGIHIQQVKPAPIFRASISLGFTRPIAVEDSGKYTCRSLQDPNLLVFYRLYVADQRLFKAPGGEKILYKRSDSSVTIPCRVSHPKAAVSLQKSVNGLVQCPLNESITYDSRKGFELKISNFFDPAGVYLCTAGYNDTFEVVKYTLEPVRGPENVVQQPTTISTSSTCQKNDDCPSHQACIRYGNGYNCSSPCSTVCGRNTQCETVNHIPRCYCLPGFRGDPYQACYGQDSQRKDPCEPSPCGSHTVCERIGEAARCSCAPGYTGDPYVRCYVRNPCDGNPCGPNSVCLYRNGYTSCSCKPGYYGQPPHCRAECEIDDHCAYDRACRYGRCHNPCDGACQQFSNTQCRVIRRQAVCARVQTRCPTGYYGRDCQSIYTKVDYLPSNSGPKDPTVPSSPCVPFPCGENAECVVKTVENAAVNGTTEVALCECPPNTTGNADGECYPIEEQIQLDRNYADTPEESENETTENSTISSIASNNTVIQTDECSPSCGTNFTCVLGACQEVPPPTTEAKSCGINAISIVTSDGKSVCACPANYTGLASIECRLLTNNDETKMELNITNSTSSPCNRFPCGKNSNCIIGEGNIAICECISQFEGNPWIGCERNCTKNDECPASQLCHEKSNRCVDPCEPEYQPFFTQCGRDAKCKVEDHVPYCYCPEEFPHGSPHVHCKEKSWMPNHRVTNSSCENEKSIKCGPNSKCKRFHDSKEYCVCLPGFFGEPNGSEGCKQGLQCRRDVQCRNNEECMNGKCLNACRKRNHCGPMAGCKAENHKANCICHIGTIQNPKGECEPATGALAERLLFYRSFEDI